MIESQFVLTLFDIVNVVVASLIGVYVFYRYGLGPLRDEVRKRFDSLIELHNRARALQQKQCDVDAAMRTEWEYGQLLLKKIGTWNTVIDQRRQRQQDERIEQDAMTQDRVVRQEHVLHQQAFDRRVAHELAHDVSAECKQAYGDERTAHKFLKEIVEQLQRETV